MRRSGALGVEASEHPESRDVASGTARLVRRLADGLGGLSTWLQVTGVEAQLIGPRCVEIPNTSNLEDRS